MPRVLILAPTFFPDPLVAAIRVTQWARHLPEFGWSPHVLCRHHGHTATPEALAAHLHPAVTVDYLGPRASLPSPGHASSSTKEKLRNTLITRVLKPLSVPDLFVWKWRQLSRQAAEIARNWQPEVVLSSSPPHSIHLAGREAANACGAPWVADFRDPYLIDARYAPRGWRRVLAGRHREFERGIYRDAALCIHAIPLHGRWAARHYPAARSRIRILTNGVPSELLDDQFLATAQRSPRLSIRAVGVLGRGAVAMIRDVLLELERRGIEAEFRHVGRAADAVADLPAALEGRVVLRGLVKHREALREIAGADVLLKYDDQERAKVNGLSSKLFEFLATGRPIVAINPTRPDAHLLKRLAWCRCLRNPAPLAVADAVEQATKSGIGPDEAWLTDFRRKHNRRNQTEQLAGWLDDLLRAGEEVSR